MEDDLDPVLDIASRLGAHAHARLDRELSTRLTSKFPFFTGRIDWDRVPGYVYLAPPSAPFDWNDYVVDVVAFLQRGLDSLDRSDPWLAYTGDIVEMEYEVERSALPLFLQLVSPLPDHKYIFSLDASWCLMWTTACQLYFGSAPDLSKRRRKHKTTP